MNKLSKHRIDQLETTVRHLRQAIIAMPGFIVLDWNEDIDSHKHTRLIKLINNRLANDRLSRVIDNSAMSASRGY